MSTNSIEKADIVHQEITIDVADAAKAERSHFHAPPTTELIEFQKKMIGPAIGFASFGLSSFLLGLFNAGVLTSVPQVAVGVAFSYGALGQFIAAIIQIIHQDVFAACSFLTFGGFYLAYGIMFLPGSGFLAAAVAAEQLEQCLFLFDISYTIAALIFFMGTFRQPIIVRIILGFTFLSFLFSAIGSITGVVAMTKVGGWFSVVIGVSAWYALMCLIYNEHNTFIKLPLF